MNSQLWTRTVCLQRNSSGYFWRKWGNIQLATIIQPGKEKKLNGRNSEEKRGKAELKNDGKFSINTPIWPLEDLTCRSQRHLGSLEQRVLPSLWTTQKTQRMNFNLGFERQTSVFQPQNCHPAQAQAVQSAVSMICRLCSLWPFSYKENCNKAEKKSKWVAKFKKIAKIFFRQRFLGTFWFHEVFYTFKKNTFCFRMAKSGNSHELGFQVGRSQEWTQEKKYPKYV